MTNLGTHWCGVEIQVYKFNTGWESKCWSHRILRLVQLSTYVGGRVDARSAVGGRLWPSVGYYVYNLLSVILKSNTTLKLWKKKDNTNIYAKPFGNINLLGPLYWEWRQECGPFSPSPSHCKMMCICNFLQYRALNLKSLLSLEIRRLNIGMTWLLKAATTLNILNDVINGRNYRLYKILCQLTARFQQNNKSKEGQRHFNNRPAFLVAC